jgi:hypothetical protein
MVDAKDESWAALWADQLAEKKAAQMVAQKDQHSVGCLGVQ